MARRRKFWRVLAAIGTGGASEVVRNKRLRNAVLTGGVSEVVRKRTAPTAGASEVTQSAVNLMRFGRLRKRNIQ